MGEENDDAEIEGSPNHDTNDAGKGIGNSSFHQSHSSLVLDITDGSGSMGEDIIGDLGDVKISGKNASCNQIMPPRRPRVRQTTETTMIMSNKSQNVHDFFTVPIEIEAEENGVEGKDIDIENFSDQKPTSWGRGISDDFKNTIAKNWRQELSNFRVKTLAVSLFLFFACIAPAVSLLIFLLAFTFHCPIYLKCQLFLVMYGLRLLSVRCTQRLPIIVSAQSKCFLEQRVVEFYLHCLEVNQ